MSHNPLPGRLAAVSFDGELPRRQDLGLVFDELDYTMAVQAYLWALPLVSSAQWAKEHHEKFRATSSDMVHYVSYRDRLGLLTANAVTPYIINFFDLSEVGPLVVELPAGLAAGGACDFWQREFVVMGHLGLDKGRGAKYLIIPPGADVPEDTEGMIVVVATGSHILFGFRTLDTNPVRAQHLVDALRVYPYERRADPPPTHIIRPEGRAWNGSQPRGLEYWARLHEIFQNEVVDERDRFYLAMLKQLGMERGKPFAPDERLSEILTQASAAGELMAQANSFAKRFENSKYWSDRHWDMALPLDNAQQRAVYYDELLERASWFYEAVTFTDDMRSRTPGEGKAYLAAYTDADGEWLDGANSYTLHIPATVPARHFWSTTVFDIRTRGLIDNQQQRAHYESQGNDLVTNDDGSVDLSFGPTAPQSGESNWVQTIPGRHWFSHFRIYGPLERYFDKSWKLGDITKV